MKLVIDSSVYKNAENGGVNSLDTLLAVEMRKDHIVVLNSAMQDVLWRICMKDDCDTRLLSWFRNMLSQKRFSFQDTDCTYLYDELELSFDDATWAIVKSDLDNVILALQCEDKIVLFYQNFSQGCFILSQHPHPRLKTINWKDTSLADTPNQICNL